MNKPTEGVSPARAKILFIGVDAGDKDLILRWAQDGVLPTFRSLLERAAWGVTTNPVGFFVGAVWPSFFTGVSPARHGRYCYEQIRAGTYDHYRFRPSDVKAEPFWDALSRAGRRVAVIDVPKTVPSAGLNGIQLVDWGTHDRDLDFCTSPRQLAAEVEARFGGHPIHKCDGARSSAAEYKGLRDALVRGVEKRFEIARHFLDQGSWDLFLTVFGESHCAGHQLWHLHDAAHPRHDRGAAHSVGDPVRDVYVAIDAAIGRLLARVGPETAVFILASHGMGPHYDGTFLLDEILDRLEKSQLSAPRRGVAQVLQRGWKRAPLAVRQLAGPLRDRAKATLGVGVSGPHAAVRKYFQIPNNDVYGAIRINLIGREPHGQVRPGPEYDALCEELSRDLLAFVNLETGKLLVRRVLRTADLYPGGNDELPDLLVEWDRERPISTVYSPKTGRIHKVYEGQRTGDHKPSGLFFALGPSIRQGPLGRPISVMDFAPTFASLLGVPLHDVEGEAVAALTGADHYAIGCGPSR